jgi:uncharacterized protein (DUF362 family)
VDKLVPLGILTTKPPASISGGSSLKGDRMSKIFVQREKEFGYQIFCENLKQMQLYDSLKTAGCIIIKPNLTGGSYTKEEAGAITPKKILVKLISFLNEIVPNVTIYIMESDSNNYDYAYQKFEFQEYNDIVKSFPTVQLYDATRSPQTTIEFNGLFFKKAIRIAEIFKGNYFFISLAKAKTHNKTVFTGVLKNQFGCLSSMEKKTYHTKIGQVISDVNQLIKPNLSILEMCPAMEGNGPLKGDKLNLELILMSDNPVAVDYLVAKRAGLLKYGIGYLDLCRKRLEPVYGNEEPRIFNDKLLDTIPQFKYIGMDKRFFIKAGLLLQGIADNLRMVSMKIQKLGE